MHRLALASLLTLSACTSDADHLPPPQQALPTSSVASSSSGAGGDGGAAASSSAASSSSASSAASTGGGPCDPFDVDGLECCAPHPTCPPGSLGVCVVEVVLCNGTCTGKPTPVPGTACESDGVCSGGECMHPPVGGAGGQGGSGGSAGAAGAGGHG